LQSLQRQRRLRIDGGDARLPTSHKGDDIDDDDDAIAMRVTMPALGWLRRNHDEGKNTVADQGRRHHCYEGDDTISTTARTLAHQQRQRCHRHEGDNLNGDGGKDACTSMATTPA
jgi:hypothetical protein